MNNNYPIGDNYGAPYNINTECFSFDAELEGLSYYNYHGDLMPELVRQELILKIKSAICAIPDIALGNIKVTIHDSTC